MQDLSKCKTCEYLAVILESRSWIIGLSKIVHPRENSSYSWTELSIKNGEIGSRSRLYQPEAFGPSGPGLVLIYPRNPKNKKQMILLIRPERRPVGSAVGSVHHSGIRSAWLANQAAANLTCFQQRSKRWGHTLHTPCQQTWLNCFEIFLSEICPHQPNRCVGTSECESPTLVLYQ